MSRVGEKGVFFTGVCLSIDVMIKRRRPRESWVQPREKEGDVIEEMTRKLPT